MDSIWTELQIERTDDAGLIRQAYAKRLKQLDVATQAEAFQALRTAYEGALAYSQREVSTEPTPQRQLGQKVRKKPVERQAPTPTFDQTTDTYSLAANALAETLFVKLRENGEAQAVQHFKALLQGDELLNLELKSRFELALLEFLRQTQHTPKLLFRTFCEAFDWLAPTANLQQRLPQYHRALKKKIATLEYYEALQEMAKDYLAPRILTGAYDPVWFFRIAIQFSANVVFKVQELLEDLQENYPEIYQYDLDERTVRWWREAHDSVAITTVRLAIVAAVIGAGVYASTYFGGMFPFTASIVLLGMMHEFSKVYE